MPLSFVAPRPFAAFNPHHCILQLIKCSLGVAVLQSRTNTNTVRWRQESTMSETPVNPLMDPQTAEYVTKWPSAINTGFVLTMAYLGTWGL